MSAKSSQIMEALKIVLEQLHNQIINDQQGLHFRQEERLIVRQAESDEQLFTALTTVASALERRLSALEAHVTALRTQMATVATALADLAVVDDEAGDDRRSSG